MNISTLFRFHKIMPNFSLRHDKNEFDQERLVSTLETYASPKVGQDQVSGVIPVCVH